MSVLKWGYYTEQDAELDPWKATQIREFEESLCLSPTSHKQLFDIGVWHLWDFKDLLERGNHSLAEIYQQVDDEKMIRKVVASWLNDHSHGHYNCAQENPLANEQRPDIWLQSVQANSPVPIELKLLDKSWSGPDLCERLRNQLAGDYLREEGAGCGIMLLVWQGHQANKRWEIQGERRNISELRQALTDYWLSIANQFPNVLSLEIIVIDLTLRAKKSDT